jgi:hypothetical protein
MATYGYSTPYTGMRQPVLPPGYMEAATAPGRNLAAGIAQLGAGIGQAIQRYQDNKAQNEAAIQTGETLFGMAQQALASDPSYQALQNYYETGQLPPGVSEADLNRFTQKVQADRSMLNRMVAIGDKFGDMSLAKKKAAIGDVAMLLQQYQQRGEQDLQQQLKRQQIALGNLQLSEADRLAKQREAERNAVIGLGQIPTEMPQFQPLPVQGAGEPSAMQDVQRLPPVKRTPEQIRSDAIAMFSSMGVPVQSLESLDKALIAAGKLPQVSTEEVPGVGTVVSMGGERKLVEQKTPTQSDIARQRALTIDFPEYKGIAPTDKEASDFREQYANVLDSKTTIQRLIEIANMGAMQQQNPQVKAEAAQLVNAAKAKLRPEIIGQGVVSDKDQAILDSIVRNPTELFSLKESNITALNSILNRAESGLKLKAKAIGLKSTQPETTAEQSQLASDPRVASIRARFQSGSITRQQAEQELRALQ